MKNDKTQFGDSVGCLTASLVNQLANDITQASQTVRFMLSRMLAWLGLAGTVYRTLFIKTYIWGSYILVAINVGPQADTMAIRSHQSHQSNTTFLCLGC